MRLLIGLLMSIEQRPSLYWPLTIGIEGFLRPFWHCLETKGEMNVTTKYVLISANWKQLKFECSDYMLN